MTTAPQSINLSRILKPSHENKWVAIAPDYSRILDAADSLPALLRSNPDAIYHRVLPADISFAP